jgi:hypothetical protein
MATRKASAKERTAAGDEVQEVEATVIESCPELSAGELAVPEVVGNIEQVSAYVVAVAERYQTFDIADEDCYRAAKGYRSDVRKVKVGIEAERKRVDAVYDTPRKEWDERVRKMLAPLTALDEGFKERLDAYDGEARERRTRALQEHYSDMAPAMVELVPYETLEAHGNGKWTNRTTTEAQAFADLESVVSGVAADERTIDGLDMSDDERRQAKADYFATLDLGSAIRGLKERREREAAVRALEDGRAEMAVAQDPTDVPDEPDAVPAPFPAPVPMAPVPMAPEPSHPWVVVVESATKGQMQELARQLGSLGVEGHIMGGTLAQAYGRQTNGR